MHVRISDGAGRRTALALTGALLLTTLTPSTADARSSWTYRSSGRVVETSWIQVDGTEPGTGAFGNVHMGWLDARERGKGRADAYGWILDFDCEEGALPDPGHGGHAEEPPFDDEEPGDDGCVHVGERHIEGYDLALAMDKKFTSATLRGQLTVYGGAHGDEGVVGRPMANVTWTGVGASVTSRFSESYNSGGYTYTYRGTSTNRSAVMGGNIGPMGFDPDLSDGSMGEYKVSERGRER